MFVQVFFDLTNGLGLVLSRVGNRTVFRRRQDPIHPGAHKHLGLHHVWNMDFLHPDDPFLFNVFVDAGCDIINQHHQK